MRPLRESRRRPVPALLAAIVGTLVATALAQTPLPYRVEAAGGPTSLAEEVAEALAAWLDGSELGLEPVEEPGADRVVAFGDPALFGPDTLSLTVQRGGEVAALLHPARYREAPAVLLHEVGAVLGAPSAAAGVMAAAIVDGAPTEPTEGDLAALRDARRFAPEDLTRDGVVDLYDLAALAESFGRRGVNLPADIDGDGVVGREDLARLQAAYRFLPPAPSPPTTSDETEVAPAGEDGLPEVPAPVGAPPEEGGAPAPEAPSPEDADLGREQQEDGGPEDDPSAP